MTSWDVDILLLKDVSRAKFELFDDGPVPILRTSTDDKDSRAMATLKEKEAHAALSSSSKRGIPSSWLSIGVLTSVPCCLGKSRQRLFSNFKAKEVALTAQ